MKEMEPLELKTERKCNPVMKMECLPVGPGSNNCFSRFSGKQGKLLREIDEHLGILFGSQLSAK